MMFKFHFGKKGLLQCVIIGTILNKVDKSLKKIKKMVFLRTVPILKP